MVCCLLMHGADPLSKNGGGWSSLQEAIASLDVEIAVDVALAVETKINMEFHKRLPSLKDAILKVVMMVTVAVVMVMVVGDDDGDGCDDGDDGGIGGDGDGDGDMMVEW